MRNLFTTKTLLAVAAFAVSIITPNLATIQKEATSYVLRRTPLEKQINVSAVISIVSALAGTGLAAAAKYSSGDFYTPAGLPGQDKK